MPSLTEESDEGSSCSLVKIPENLYNYLQHKRGTCELTITSELICMKRVEQVTGNFCGITSIHFANVYKQSSWDSQFKLLIYIQVYSNRKMEEVEINTKKKLSRKDLITIFLFFSILKFVAALLLCS